MLNWSEHKEEEKSAERCFWLELLMAALLGIALAAILGSLMGCATVSPSPRSEVCVLQLLGQTTDSGLPVVKTYCVSPEAFAESQK